MNSKDPGRLEVICGPMFSGKTTELIRRLRDAAGAGLSVAAFKPAADDRYHGSSLAAHDGGRLDASGVGGAGEILTGAAGAQVVGIDEAHFFGAVLEDVCLDLLEHGARVIVAGVERDHRGQSFEPFPALLCEADEVVKLSGPCAVCGKPAVHTQRMTGGSDRVVVGGPGMYEARCRACFRPGV